MDYQVFLKQKAIVDAPTGFSPTVLNKHLMPFQADIVRWALIRGRAAIFADCGLGKTIMQLEWANQVHKHTKKPIIILAPLAVSEQTQQEGEKFGIAVNICESQDDVINGINIINYEKIHKIQAAAFSGVVLDESSIIKDFTGSLRNLIISTFAKTPYRLACTATPAPNDYVELGNHAEFVGAMTRSEMLSMFFINDTSDTGTWRLKGHAATGEFWKWLCSWAVALSKPSDLGYDDGGFILPPIEYHEHIIPSDKVTGLGLFVETVVGMNERRAVRSETVETRCQKAAELVNNTDEKWILWCGLNPESTRLTELVKGAIEVTGAQDHPIKSKAMLDFANGKIHRIVTKPKIAGRGMNWQVCHNMIFVGLNDSWEDLYQAVRRIWRFGQKFPVHVHIIIDEREGSVLDNVKKKDVAAQEMLRQMVRHTQTIMTKTLRGIERTVTKYNPSMEMEIPEWLVSM